MILLLRWPIRVVAIGMIASLIRPQSWSTDSSGTSSRSPIHLSSPLPGLRLVESTYHNPNLEMVTQPDHGPSSCVNTSSVHLSAPISKSEYILGWKSLSSSPLSAHHGSEIYVAPSLHTIAITVALIIMAQITRDSHNMLGGGNPYEFICFEPAGFD